MLEKTLESPLDSQSPVHSKGHQSWVFFGRTDAKAETPVLWPPDAKSWLIGKDYDAGRDSGQEKKGMTEDEMAGWHHQLDGCESEWTLGVGDGQGGLACSDSWGHKESDTTEQLNWTELTEVLIYQQAWRYLHFVKQNKEIFPSNFFLWPLALRPPHSYLVNKTKSKCLTLWSLDGKGKTIWSLKLLVRVQMIISGWDFHRFK